MRVPQRGREEDESKNWNEQALPGFERRQLRRSNSPLRWPAKQALSFSLAEAVLEGGETLEAELLGWWNTAALRREPNVKDEPRLWLARLLRSRRRDSH